MKKYLLISLILIFLIGLFAQQPISMRNIASDGLFEADWDYIFDPINLGKSDSLYFFTNMADFSYKYNDLLGDVNEDAETNLLEELPLGIALNNPLVKDLRHSFYIRFMNNLTPDPNIAETECYTTDYIDQNGDDFYDLKTITYEYEIDNEEDRQHLDFIWNNHFEFDTYSLGLKFSSFYFCENYDDATLNMGSNNFDPLGYLDGIGDGKNNFDYYKEFYDFENDELFYDISEAGDFNTEISDNQTKLLLSADLENHFLIKDSMLRFNLGYDHHKDLSQKVDDDYSASYSYIYPDSLVDTGSISETYNKKQVINQDHFYLSSRLKKGLKGSFDGNAGFCEFALLGGLISGDSEGSYDSNMSSQIVYNDTIPEDIITEENNSCFAYCEKGDHTGFDFNTHFRMNLPLNNYALFGIGCYYGYTYLNYQLNHSSKYNISSATTTGSLFDDDDDIISTSHEFLSADKESINQKSYLRIPIALEFKIADDQLTSFDVFSLRNFVYRLGTTFIYNTRNIEDTYNDVIHQPHFEIIEYGDGTVYESHEGENTLKSEKTITKSNESLKRFSAGIGYKHSQNVRIDLATYYDCDTEDYYFGLSFTIKK